MSSSLTASNFTRATPSPLTSAPAQPGRMARWGTAAWQALEGVGRARARRELLILADRWQAGQPELAAQLRAACRDPAGA
jgi:hypothetical protein